MTPTEFKKAQETLGLTNQAMADRLCCGINLVEKMRQGTRPVSTRTVKMIEREMANDGHR
jgi:DNA-binding transcriptional regulator YdaS (Cro superfamily)